jgi:enoyl-CoA hydratase
MEMIMTAGMIDANRALETGLVNHVVPQNELLDFCKKLSGKISNNSSVAIGHAIKAVNAGFKHDSNGYAAEIKAFGKCFGTADFEEGTSAFLEKRKADFPGK